MRLGIVLPIDFGAQPAGLQPGGDVVSEGARAAEANGFDSVWFFDSIGRGRMSLDPLMGAAVAAATTERIEVGLGILQVPLRHPVELAQRVLTAQLVCGPRLLLGVGSGSTRVDFEADQAPNPNAPLSDRDRIAQSPTAAEDPLNNLPNADGNSMRFVESEDPSDALEPDLAAEAAEAPNREEEPAESRFEDASGDVADAETADASRSAEAPREEDGRLSDELVEQLLADGALSLPGGGEPDPDDFDPDADRPADGLLGRAMRNLDRYARRQTFNNQRGQVNRFAPQIQFDSKGADFGPWLRRFVAQVYRNWFMPYAIMSMHGNVVLTFSVHRDGSITDLSVMRPSRVNAFTNSAFNAISTSNPTYPLPDDYPDDSCFFTVTFYFNESPPPPA